MSFLKKLFSIFSKSKKAEKSRLIRVSGKPVPAMRDKKSVETREKMADRGNPDKVLEDYVQHMADSVPPAIQDTASTAKFVKNNAEQRTMILNRGDILSATGTPPSAQKFKKAEDTAGFDSSRIAPLFEEDEKPPTASPNVKKDVPVPVKGTSITDRPLKPKPLDRYGLLADEPVAIVPPERVADPVPVRKVPPSASPTPVPPPKKEQVPAVPLEKGPAAAVIKEDDNRGETRKTPIVCMEYSPESQQIIALTEKRFPELVPFMENLLYWIEQNLGQGLLTQSVQQIYAADIDFELEPADFLLRVLQGIQINNLGPLFKIVYLRAERFLTPELTASILETVSSFESQIRTLHLVEIFPWQKKRSIMRRILDKVPADSKPALFDLLEKSTREKTKERTIQHWLEIMLDEVNYFEPLDGTARQELSRLAEEFRRSTAETQVFSINMEQMMAKAEHDKRVQKLHDYLVDSLRDLQDRKGRLVENLFPLLDILETPALDALSGKIERENELDVYIVLKYLFASIGADAIKASSLLQDMLIWKDELKMKEALKRMYFVSRAYKHDLLTKSLLILGCLSENDAVSYAKKVNKINVLYNFDLDRHLLDHPFNPNSTKATTPGTVKYTLQFEEKNGGKKQREEMILYRGGTILAKMVIPLEDSPRSDTSSPNIKRAINHVQRCAFALETMINFYESVAEITREVRQKNQGIWDRQGILSLKEMVKNKQAQLLHLDSAEFGLASIEGLSFPGMAYIVAKLVDDVYLPLNNYVLKILKIEHS